MINNHKDYIYVILLARLNERFTRERDKRKKKKKKIKERKKKNDIPRSVGRTAVVVGGKSGIRDIIERGIQSKRF